MSTMLNVLSRKPSASASTRTCPTISPARQVPDQTHLAGKAERAGHRASDLGRDAEGHRRRVGNEHRLDLTTVSELQQELLGPVGRPIARDDLGGSSVGSRGRGVARSSAGRSDIASGIGDAVTIDPREDLPGAETRDGRATSQGASSAARSSSARSGCASLVCTVSATPRTTCWRADPSSRNTRAQACPSDERHVIVHFRAGNPFSVKALRHVEPARRRRSRVPAASSTLSNSPIITRRSR